MTDLVTALVALYTLLLSMGAAGLSALESALIVLREKARPDRSTSGPSRQGYLDLLRDPASALPGVFLHSALINLLLITAGFYLSLVPLAKAGFAPWQSGLALVVAGMIFVELLPRLAAMRSPEKWAGAMLPVYRILNWILKPLTRLLLLVGGRLVTRFTPKRLKRRAVLSSDEIETLVDMREEQQVINADESALLHGMVSLNELTVKDGMTPRVDLPLMPHDASDAEAVNMLEGARHRFVAVFDMKLDSIAYLVDVQRWKLTGRPHWSTITHVPVFAPETQSLLEAWRESLPHEGSAVVVVDEFGGFEGVLTRHNVTERVLAKAAPSQYGFASIQSIGPNRYLVAGSTRLDEIERELDVTLEAEGVDTIGGLVMNLFGYPPKPGERLTVGGLDIKVKKTARARVQQLELRVLNPEGGTP